LNERFVRSSFGVFDLTPPSSRRGQIIRAHSAAIPRRAVPWSGNRAPLKPFNRRGEQRFAAGDDLFRRRSGKLGGAFGGSLALGRLGATGGGLLLGCLLALGLGFGSARGFTTGFLDFAFFAFTRFFAFFFFFAAIFGSPIYPSPTIRIDSCRRAPLSRTLGARWSRKFTRTSDASMRSKMGIRRKNFLGLAGTRQARGAFCLIPQIRRSRLMNDPAQDTNPQAVASELNLLFEQALPSNALCGRRRCDFPAMNRCGSPPSG